MTDRHSLWVEKYRPKSLSDYIFQNKSDERSIREIIETGDIPNLLFHGGAGSGKTTLANILTTECGIDEMDIIKVNGSDEGRRIDEFSSTVMNFISGFPLGKYRIVIIDEADYLNRESVQPLLRVPLEEFSETARFIFTCNYPDRIIPAIKSRCQSYGFKAPKIEHVVKYAMGILAKEGVKYDVSNVADIVQAFYPDIRKITHSLQKSSVGKVLQVVTDDDADWQLKMLDLIEREKLGEIRDMVCEHAVNEADIIGLYRFLFDNIRRAKRFSSQDSYDSAVVVIAEHLYRAGSVADQEINFAACMIKLMQI